MTKKFIEDKTKIQMWNGYLNRIGNEFIDFSQLMKRINSFLYPVYGSILEDKEFFKNLESSKILWGLK